MSQKRGAKGPGYREPPAPFEPFTEINGNLWVNLPPERHISWVERKVTRP